MATVVIIGSGVAGLTAAHELAERGFQVHVVEKDLSGATVAIGGKAASATDKCPVNPAYGSFAPLTLPVEHGFHFFPSFYVHLVDTMSRTPAWNRATNPGPANQPWVSVADNLLPVFYEAVAFDDGQDLVTVERRLPSSVTSVLSLLRETLQRADYTLRDVAQYELKVFQLMTSCPERRLAEYDAVSWFDFAHGKVGVGPSDPTLTYSAAFDKYMDAAPRLLIAMDAKHGAARTQGEVLVQMLLDQVAIDGTPDRVLNGPSATQWMGPWRDYLTGLGVTFHNGVLASFDYTAGVAPVWSGAVTPALPAAAADYYVLAVAMPDANAILSGSSTLLLADASENPDAPLQRFLGLDPVASTAWLSGMQFYLSDDVEILRGHVGLADSEWGISLVSQAQFWGDDFVSRYGAGHAGTILSVDVGNWTAPGRPLTSGTMPAANQCTVEQFVWEVWGQIRDSLHTSRLELPAWAPMPSPTSLAPAPSIIVSWHVDPKITFNVPGTNATPMFINPPGSWALRPGPLATGYRVRLGKLVLAGDYTQTYTGLPCMEGANESARHAVNAILEHVELAESPAQSRPFERCAIWPLEPREPDDLSFFKELDAKLFAQGVPNIVQTLGWEKLMVAVPDNLPATSISVDLLAQLITGIYPILTL